MTTPKELAEELAEALMNYYGTNNVHPDDMSDIDDLVGVVLPIIEARDQHRAEEFRRLAAEAQIKGDKLEITLPQTSAAYLGQADALTEAAQMVEDKLG